MDLSINFEKVDYIYQPNTPFAHQALNQVSFSLPDESYTAIIGHTGSGKSTLVQHLNGLLKPTHGRLMVQEQMITPQTTNKELSDLRRQVGVVFQFPEAQLFEETVLRDIAFAPKNFGIDEEKAAQLAKEAAEAVRLPDSVLDKSPFELSGGQMRRVAIAGILVMKPKVLVLDEPTAGLDPKGHQEIMELFARLKSQQHLTVILVSHQMDDVAEYADQVLVMEQGKLLTQQTPQQLFSQVEWLNKHHLGLPHATKFAFEIEKKSTFKFSPLPLTVSQLANQLANFLPKGVSQDE
ncbi:cobalt transporter ATP-binding subunit [Liquorilactobacillus vini DSM 20605]|uniref:Energy-coupling factor transporter ATP-binding protein EcfA2 n=2 Tax=Liquorilactobacillus vini TaxID=238015 RepID=A0A0R2CDM1_9LACO|nr:cobalt transporter ATP-binding subunit [Liquorilactobacillus vini DSM 20605]